MAKWINSPSEKVVSVDVLEKDIRKYISDDFAEKFSSLENEQNNKINNILNRSEKSEDKLRKLSERFENIDSDIANIKFLILKKENQSLLKIKQIGRSQINYFIVILIITSLLILIK